MYSSNVIILVLRVRQRAVRPSALDNVSGHRHLAAVDARVLPASAAGVVYVIVEACQGYSLPTEPTEHFCLHPVGSIFSFTSSLVESCREEGLRYIAAL